MLKTGQPRNGKCGDERLDACRDLGGLGTIVGIDREAVGDDLGQGRRNGRRERQGLVAQLRPARLAIERPVAGGGAEHRGAERPDVAGRPDDSAPSRLALLRCHVFVRTDRVVECGGILDVHGHREIDELRRRAHDDVAGLDVEMADAFSPQVVQGGGELETERQQLVDRQGAVDADQ